MEKELKRFKHQTSRRALIYSWASVACFIFGVIGIYYWTVETVPSKEPTLITGTIKPGSPKAYLVLENHEKVLLTDSCAWIMHDGVMTRDSAGMGLTYSEKSKGITSTEPVRLNRLVVPRGGEYKLTLADGTKIWMNAESELEYPIHFSDTARNVSLKGEAYFEVAKDKHKPFHVRVGDLDIQVYGTMFNVNTHVSGKIQAVLVEGKIGVQVLKTGDQIILHPSQLVNYDMIQKKMEVKQVNTRRYTAWRNGRFLFEEERLENVLEQLSRWYDVEIVYTNTEVKDLLIFGSMKHYDSIEVILNAIEKNVNVHFKINGKTITVTK